MKLYVIGTSPQSNIQLRSQYGSSYHAELLLLDNGDMLLTDRGSKNGTYVNGKKITPDKDVNVRRGDEVVFADERLDWNRIPANTVDMTKVKEIRSIGSHHLNRILLQGEHVSRFHATMKKMADGKWYIQDHSKNGTSINGNRIPKDQDVRIKRGDKISCAGHMVENPVPPGPNWGIIGGVAAAVAVIVALAFGLRHILRPDYKDTLLALVGEYHYEVYINGKLEERYPEYENILYSGTGFFISEDGKIITNLHLANPWLFEPEVKQELKQYQMERLQKSAAYSTYSAENWQDISEAARLSVLSSMVEVRGVLDNIYVFQSGKIISLQNNRPVTTTALTATVTAVSDNTNVDLAVLQLDEQKLPEGASYVRTSSISTSSEDVQVGDKLRVYGFPQGFNLQNVDNVATNNRIKLEPYYTEGICTISGTNVDFGHNAMTESGSSGSPIFNSKGKLVGVNSAHQSAAKNNNYNIGVDAALIHTLLNKTVNF